VLNNASLIPLHLLLAAGKENLILNGGDELRAKLTQLEDLHKKGALLTAAAALLTYRPVHQSLHAAKACTFSAARIGLCSNR
jgi:hypothetical protein